VRESSFWNVTFSRILSTYAVLIFAVLWIGFVFALTVNQEWLNSIWIWVQTLPLVGEIIVWVLFLPIMVGLWAWQSSWPIFVQLIVFAALIGWTLLAVSSFVKAIR
jgi:hypothetical protein